MSLIIPHSLAVVNVVSVMIVSLARGGSSFMSNYVDQLGSLRDLLY